MTNKEYMEKVISLLESQGVRRRGNINKIGRLQEMVLPYQVDSWMKQFYDITKNHFDSYVKRINMKESDRAYFVSNRLDLDTVKYMCIFPSSIVLTDSFSLNVSAGSASATYTLSKSFIEKLFENRKYIENDIFTLFPESFIFYMSYGAGPQIDTLGGSYNYNYNKNIDYTGKNGIRVDQEHIADLFFTFPWLYGARTEDYLNIINKYSVHYNNYRNTIYKFLQVIKNGQDDVSDLFYDIKQAHINMQIQFENAKNELYTKGIQVILGLAFTFIPLLFDIPPEIKASLQAILGTTTVKEAYALALNTKQELKKMNNTNPYYVTWKWEKKNSK